MIIVSVHKQQQKKNRKVVINVKSSYKVTPKYRGRIKARSLTEVIHSVVNWPYKLIWSNSERTTTCPKIKHVRVTVVYRQHVYGDNTKKHLQDSTSALFTKVWLRAFTQWRVTLYTTLNYTIVHAHRLSVAIRFILHVTKQNYFVWLMFVGNLFCSWILAEHPHCHNASAKHFYLRSSFV